ncbi:hypothetical protein MSAN_01498700 [Mycena sanguinolenta]|uniref:Protein kinase domain-containing protein n=1 Tax=Mycena sanguinolenta TaxID=230812 RepID=A0A8H6Y645_9AGAR|nr:hypothetical protein MSAN_01498700 [Mycena sanguinolenta]
MDPQADCDEDFIVLSTSDYTESTSHTRNVESFIKSFSFLPSLRKGRFQTRRTSEAHTQKYSETKSERQAIQHLVNNYYHITGGFGGSGGEGGGQGGDGGTGQGPTVYFGQPQAQESSGIQTIRLEDINLMKTIRLDPHSDVVGCRSRGVGVRRIYHAEIRRDPGTVTVAMYQGDGAEDEWRHHVAKYESIRHPNIMQLYGLVSTKGLYAMIFHDELIPYTQFLCRFEHSPILRTYIFGCSAMEFWEATHYISGVSRKPLIDFLNLPGWMQPRTGQLCLDLAQGGVEMGSELPWWDTHVLRLESISLDAPGSEDIIISTWSEEQYHKLCSRPSIARHHWFQISTEHPVGPGIFRSDSQYGTCVRITEPLQILPKEEPRWNHYRGASGELLPNSWIRYDSRQISYLRFSPSLPSLETRMAWLAQANRIFAELEKTAHAEDYVCVHRVEFTLRITDEREIPEGYLFVCPPDDLRTSTEHHANLYQWPACPAYWSLDPSGADRLSTEDARNLGFPAIHIETFMIGVSWDHGVYQGLRRFHEGKGHHPESQEVARQLGYPLLEVLSDCVPFPAREVDRWSRWCEKDDPSLCRSLGHYL